MASSIELLEDAGAWSGRGTLHRALRSDVRFPFAAIGGAGEPYAVVHEDGTVDIDGGVLLIEPFEVPAEAADAFPAAWEAMRAVLATGRGYMGARLLRGEREPRFVAVVRWSSPLMYARVTALPELEAAAVAFPSHPALYSAAGSG